MFKMHSPILTTPCHRVQYNIMYICVEMVDLRYRNNGEPMVDHHKSKVIVTPCYQNIKGISSH